MSIIELLPRYSYSDYAIWEGEWEMIEGFPVSMAPAPTRKHQQIARELFTALNQKNLSEYECEVLYEVDWKISEDTVVRPDIVLVCHDDNENYLTKAPQVIVEVLSPSTAHKDETVKFNLYEDEKVNYYIMVYPDDLRAKVYTLKDDTYRKIGDFTKEVLVFEHIDCSLELDFEKVFRSFRK